ncbi:MAG: undecaprenyl-diphosphate phosphatase [Thermoplasmatota archaeon]
MVAEGPTLAQAIVLAVVQGLTEWLPISSSAHLVVAQRLMGVDVPVAFSLWLHAGTLVAVVVNYRVRIAALFFAVLAPRREPSATRSADRRFAFSLILATIPVGLAGIALGPWVEQAFSSLAWVGLALLGTATLLGLASWSERRRAGRPAHPVGLADAAAIGLVQVAALLPGLSRSGSTISAGVLRGLDRRTAVEFSFLLSIPLLAGALVLKAPELADLAIHGGAVPIVGFLVSAVVGLVSIRPLLGIVTRAPLWTFAAYCAGTGSGLLLATSLG